jgi:hypothetical protein
MSWPRFILIAALLLGGLACGDDGSSEMAGSDAGAVDAEAAGDTWTSFARDFFATYCVACHNDDPTHLRNYTMLADVRRDMEMLRCGIAPSALPGCTAALALPASFPVGDGPRPSDEERERLVAWIEAGLPE